MVFKPDDREELEEAKDVWLTDKEQALNDYGDINTWDVTNVTNMSFLFSDTNFNDDISSWDVSNVTDMEGMFCQAKQFNQPLDHWDISQVREMSFMFVGAYKFNQSLYEWNISPTTRTDNMIANTSLGNIYGTDDIHEYKRNNKQ